MFNACYHFSLVIFYICLGIYIYKYIPEKFIHQYIFCKTYKNFPMNDKFLFDMETFFLALADKTRLRLLNLMRGGEVCVCFFTEVLNESQPKISRHLAYLRSAGVVETRRDGKWMNYRIKEPENKYAAQVLEDTLEWLKSEELMQNDYEKLAAACYSAEAPVAIAHTPKPNILPEAYMSVPPKEEMETFLL